jgi:hypothetical protein
MTCVVYCGSPAGHPPAAPLPPPLAAFVELCNVTPLTPSMRRSRSSITATAGWLTAQPLIVNCGMLPGGVAEVTVELAPPFEAGEPVEGGLEAEAPALEAEPDAPPAVDDDPSVPDSEETEIPEGSTRPNSWKA